MKFHFLILTFVVTFTSLYASSLTELSPAERKELDERIARFYSAPFDSAEEMQRPVPSWKLHEGTWKKPSNGGRAIDPCPRLRKHFPELYRQHCEPKSWEVMGAKDRPEFLTKGIVAPEQIIYSLSRLPTKGQAKRTLWSDDYWAIRSGGVGYRYADGIKYSSFDQAIQSYSQPFAWSQLVAGGLTITDQATARWSPAEKYDITVGDDLFSMVAEQRQEGHDIKKDYQGQVPGWMGICDGWSAATMMLPAPQRAVTVIGANSSPVTWYPADIRAMASLAWAHGNYPMNFIGGRCETETPATFPNGRISDPKCFDNNPAAFHVGLTNLMGVHGSSLVMDRMYSLEVWNQPIQSYEIFYFNPLDPQQRSYDWRKVAVKYDQQFRARDRFQNPPTRGERISRVVGVVATVVYLEEISPPIHGPVVQAASLERKTYTYDLELYEEGGDVIPLGGEWHENKHPDFLWLPRPGAVSTTAEDKQPLDYKGYFSAPLTTLARSASAKGMPLCRVVKYLFEKSAGQTVYDCGP